MLQPATLKFLTALKKNNNKPWFDAHRDQYELAKADILLLTGQLIGNIAVFDPPIGNFTAKDCTFRINRDVRFSKDKSPYKSNMAAYFNKGGKKSNGAGYYIHIEPGKSFAAAGLWMPEPKVLANIRQEIDYNFEDWKKLVGNAAFKKMSPVGLDTGDTLVRPPKGYEDNNPAIQFLKLKSFVVRRPITDTELKDKHFLKTVAKIFQVMKPLVDFLNRAAD